MEQRTLLAKWHLDLTKWPKRVPSSCLASGADNAPFLSWLKIDLWDYAATGNWWVAGPLSIAISRTDWAWLQSYIPGT